MDSAAAPLRGKIMELVTSLKQPRRPSRNELLSGAERVLEWKREHRVESLWTRPPVMVTATLDDAWGHGLEVIHRYAEVAGLAIFPLGLMKTPAEIIQACLAHNPDILGLTVLQFDTEEALIEIRNAIPGHTRMVVGGPIFAADPDLARRAGIDFVARNAAAFIAYLLDFQPSRKDAAN